MHEHRIENLKARFSVIVCSSTRTKENDTSGQEINSSLKEAGHEVSFYEVVRDDPEMIEESVKSAISKSDVLIISGGTGITSRDVTIETVRSMAEKEIHSFSTVFALLSYQQIGTSAIMSNSSAFLIDRKPVFCLPGSPSGASLGVKGIILKEIDHILHESRR
jgi:molybdenum cofactor biosynthesis protein B